ncbi:translation machinery-associated protein 16 [Allomyces javanicus]|nr:translation machinery-associated protein 16 [Allomyces javanicus]
MPNNKVKSLKKVGKVDNVHPFSRKAKQAKRAMLRDDRIARTSRERDEVKVGPQLERYRFVRDHLDPSLKAYTYEQMHGVIEQFLVRHQAELEELVREREAQLHGKKKPREDLLVAMMAQERSEYEKYGLTIPNLAASKVVEALRTWDGNPNAMELIKTVLVRPPKKASAAAAPASSSSCTDASPQDALQAKIAELTGMTVE